jgi:hypothetical protein
MWFQTTKLIPLWSRIDFSSRIYNLNLEFGVLVSRAETMIDYRIIKLKLKYGAFVFIIEARIDSRIRKLIPMFFGVFKQN